MATGPVIPNDPIELLTYDPTRAEPFINKYWAAGLCGTLSFLAVCFGKYSTKRPVFSGLQSHILGTLAGAYIGQVVENYRQSYLSERDAVLRHYIQLHPEDFPIEERKKFKEVLESWVPIR